MLEDLWKFISEGKVFNKAKHYMPFKPKINKKKLFLKKMRKIE